MNWPPTNPPRTPPGRGTIQLAMVASSELLGVGSRSQCMPHHTQDACATGIATLYLCG